MTVTTQPRRETYPDAAQAMVDVVPMDARRWQAAIDDAYEVAYSVDRRRTVSQLDITMTAFVISGSDVPGRGYGVVVSRDRSNGNVHTMCDCENGRDGYICWHAAEAITTLDAWPSYVPVNTYRRPVIVDGDLHCPACGTDDIWQSQKLQMPRGYVDFWRCRCGWTAEVA